MDWNELSLLLIDKLLIGILILIVGLWINKKLQEYKIGLEENVSTRVRIAERRLPAYRKLWEITQPTTKARVSDLSMEKRKDLYDNLCGWYYESGYGIFLSNKTRDSYLDAREVLIRDNISDDKITKIFSKLRSDIKSEIGIYG